MWRYVAKRLGQAIPTVIGVVLITFVLFNVVGGSPAALVLGQNAGARSLEEFDAARGYDKPLFCGRWTKTRALETVYIATSRPGARGGLGRGRHGGLRLRRLGQELVLPLAFPLPADCRWRLTVEGRGPVFHRRNQFSTAWKKVFHGVKNGIPRGRPGQESGRCAEKGTLISRRQQADYARVAGWNSARARAQNRRWGGGRPRAEPRADGAVPGGGAGGQPDAGAAVLVSARIVAGPEPRGGLRAYMS
jgi:hypothetical protein